MEERFKKLLLVQEKTFEEILKQLKDYRKCMLIRPTGFGKTYTMVKLACDFTSNHPNSKIVYLYPREIIKTMLTKDYEKKLNGVDFMDFTYYLLGRIWSNVDEDSRYANLEKAFSCLDQKADVLFILDEVHTAGAPLARETIKWLQERFPKAYWFGGTATPYRGDDFNVLEEFFDGHHPFEYGLQESITDGIYPKPCYNYIDFEAEEELKKCVDIVSNSLLEDSVKNKMIWDINRQFLQHFNSTDFSDILLDSVGVLDYQKWIVFFPTQEILESKYDLFINWFKKAYPDFEINTLIVTSTSKYKANVSKVPELKERSKCIDLILSIDMLNMGYHVGNITVSLCFVALIVILSTNNKLVDVYPLRLKNLQLSLIW